jgi:hypothetical protein
MSPAAEVDNARLQTSDSIRLSSRGTAIAFALLWGGGTLCLGLVHLANPAYGTSFLNGVSSIYPGFHGARSLGDVVMGAAYAFVDGALGGAIFAWLYNRVSQRTG